MNPNGRSQIDRSDYLELTSTIKQHDVRMSNRLKKFDLFLELGVGFIADPVMQQLLDSDNVLSPLALPHLTISSYMRDSIYIIMRLAFTVQSTSIDGLQPLNLC